MFTPELVIVLRVSNALHALVSAAEGLAVRGLLRRRAAALGRRASYRAAAVASTKHSA
jgi:hypothetical protein